MVARQPEIVGREAELEAVEAFFADLRSPTGLLFEGEAGIGKTTLWRHAIEIAEEHGFRVLSCTGSSAETQLAFTRAWRSRGGLSRGGVGRPAGAAAHGPRSCALSRRGRSAA